MTDTTIVLDIATRRHRPLIPRSIDPVLARKRHDYARERAAFVRHAQELSDEYQAFCRVVDGVIMGILRRERARA
jgi:hypothetical protein